VGGGLQLCRASNAMRCANRVGREIHTIAGVGRCSPAPQASGLFQALDRNQFCSRLLVDPRPAAVSTVSRHMSAGRRTLSGLWTSLFAFRNQYYIHFV